MDKLRQVEPDEEDQFLKDLYEIFREDGLNVFVVEDEVIPNLTDSAELPY